MQGRSYCHRARQEDLFCGESHRTSDNGGLQMLAVLALDQPWRQLDSEVDQ